jgi:hypothetical protein
MQIDQIARDLPVLFCALFVAILFLQSGLDKVFDWKGNLSWLTGHFSKTFLAKMVPIMFVTITVMELATGVFAAAGIFYYVTVGSLIIVFVAALLGTSSLTALFFGQRVAKDYPGAAILVPYFLLLVVMMYLANPYARQ